MEKLLRKALRSCKFVSVSTSRSKVMRAIRGKGNRSTEWRARMKLVRSEIDGWTMHNAMLPGRPDIYFPNERLAIFLDGCFWHGCPLCGHIPHTNKEFWRLKLVGNRRRDERNTARIRRAGISVLRVWEHELIDNRWLRMVKSKLHSRRRQ
jgi:DNA mismatch endonuclease Vsr